MSSRPPASFEKTKVSLQIPYPPTIAATTDTAIRHPFRQRAIRTEWELH